MSKTGHQFDSTILREYDIRGIVGTTLHAADAGAIGRAFGTLVRRNGGRKVALGYAFVGIGVGLQAGIGLVLWMSAALERRFILPTRAERPKYASRRS